MDRYEGLREFVVARGPALSRTAYLLTGDHQLAEDLLQQALVKTATRWRKIVAGGNPPGRALAGRRRAHPPARDSVIRASLK